MFDWAVTRGVYVGVTDCLAMLYMQANGLSITPGIIADAQKWVFRGLCRTKSEVSHHLGDSGGAAKCLDKTTNLNKIIKPSRRDDITNAISNNVLPTRNKSSNDLILRLDGKQYTKLQQR